MQLGTLVFRRQVARIQGFLIRFIRPVSRQLLMTNIYSSSGRFVQFFRLRRSKDRGINSHQDVSVGLLFSRGLHRLSHGFSRVFFFFLNRLLAVFVYLVRVTFFLLSSFLHGLRSHLVAVLMT